MIHNTEDDIKAVCEEIANMLIEKNRSYGDSALTPVRIFSKDASPIEQLNVRMDDKLSRLLKGDAKAFGEDVEKDLLGYLILKRVALRRQKVEQATATPTPSSLNVGARIDGRDVDRELGNRPVASPGYDESVNRHIAATKRA